MRSVVHLLPISLSTIDFDGYATFEVESFEKSKAELLDPCCINVIALDEREFLNKSDQGMLL